jgi:uncharacterized protein (DUF342 family)
MGTKKLTISRPTTEEAIRDGLKTIGLSHSKVVIKILRRESHGFLRNVDAIIALIYSEDDSKQALFRRAQEKFSSGFRIRFQESKIKIQVPKSLFDENFLKTEEERNTFLLAYLETRDVISPDLESIKKICGDVQSQHHFITVKELETEPINEDGAAIFLELSADEMELEAAIFHEGIITQNSILEILEKKGFIQGIFKKTLNHVLQNKFEGYFKIAKGTPPTDDKPASIQKYFNDSSQNHFSEMAGTVDTRTTKEINVVSRNELLVEIGDPIEGKNGFSILGKTVLKKTANISQSIQIGKNVYMNDQGTEVFAKSAGHIVWDADKHFLDVEPIYIVEGNVDFSEGNVTGFVGKVIVTGDVKPKFSVIVEGDIEIQGSVEDAIVESTRGSVTILGTVVHQTEGYVKATDTVNVSIAMNANIQATYINIDKEAVNSTIKATKEVSVLGTPGVIVGGVVSAKKCIRAKVIGSENWVKTKINVGNISALQKEIQKLNFSLTEAQKRADEYKGILKILEKKQESQEVSDAEKLEIEKSEENIESLNDDIAFYSNKIAKNKEQINNQVDARLEVEELLHPQVDVHIYEGYFLPEKKEPRSGFQCKQGLIVHYTI